MKFRKKPVVIEATQWFKDGDHPMVISDENEGPYIHTLEGAHRVSPGDWIITGIKGEHYPCKPDIFALTYDTLAAQPAEQSIRPLPDHDNHHNALKCPYCNPRGLKFAEPVAAAGDKS